MKDAAALLALFRDPDVLRDLHHARKRHLTDALLVVADVLL